MATKAGTLIVDFIAETQKFREDLKSLGTTLGQQASAMSSSVGSIESAFNLATKAAAVFGIGLGAAEIVGFIANTIRATAQIKTLADQVGLTTTQFQVFRFEATQLGVSTDAMDTTIARLTRRVGEAADGNKDAIKTFNSLGVGVLNSANQTRPIIDIYRDVADAIARLPDPAARAAAEVALLGRGAQQLDPLLRQGGAGFDQAAIAAEKFGDIIGPDQIEHIDKLNNQIDEMKLHFSALATEIIGAAAPAVSDFFDGVRKGIEKLENEPLFKVSDAPFSLIPSVSFGTDPVNPGNELGHYAGAGGTYKPPAGSSGAGAGGNHNPPDTSGIERTQAVIDGLKFEAEQLTRTAAEQALYNSLKQAQVPLESAAGQAIAKYSDQIAQEKAELQEIKDAGAAWDKEVAEAKALHDSLRTDQERQNDAMARAVQLNKDGLLSQEDLNRSLEDYNSLLASAASIHSEVQTAEEKANAARELATELFNKGLISATDYERKLKELAGTNDEFAGTLDTIAGAFADGITGATTWQQALTTAIKAVAAELEKMLGVGANGSSAGSELEGIGSGFLSFLGFGGGGPAPGIGTTGPMAGLGGQGALLGFDSGADFTVGGNVGADQNVVAFRASRGERVRVTDGSEADNGRPAVYVHPGAVVMQIMADHDTYKRSEGQVTASAARGLQRALRRNGA